MSLTRGVTSNFPCPRCLIPRSKQGVYPPISADARTSAISEETVEEARLLRVGEKEELLKSVGLRDVNVCVIFSFIPLLLTISLTECVLEN